MFIVFCRESVDTFLIFMSDAATLISTSVIGLSTNFTSSAENLGRVILEKQMTHFSLILADLQCV